MPITRPIIVLITATIEVLPSRGRSSLSATDSTYGCKVGLVGKTGGLEKATTVGLVDDMRCPDEREQHDQAGYGQEQAGQHQRGPATPNPWRAVLR